jgi:hypothetical protein
MCADYDCQDIPFVPANVIFSLENLPVQSMGFGHSNHALDDLLTRCIQAMGTFMKDLPNLMAMPYTGLDIPTREFLIERLRDVCDDINFDNKNRKNRLYGRYIGHRNTKSYGEAKNRPGVNPRDGVHPNWRLISY